MTYFSVTYLDAAKTVAIRPLFSASYPGKGEGAKKPGVFRVKK
jgi:hypothetical protein